LDAVVRTHPWDDVLVGARRLSGAATGGALAGLLVGGVGGRVAMLALRLTSDPRLRGLDTDDGFTIGVVSADTLFLLGITAVLGAVVGVAYLLVRGWLPPRLRPWVFGALGGAVGGAAIVRPDGLDFTLLDPVPLAIAMFVAIPAAGGVLTALLAERFLREGSVVRSSWVAPAVLVLVLLLPVGVGLLGPIGMAILLAVGTAIVLMGRGPDVARLWRSSPVTWLGRAALVAVFVAASVVLARDVAAVL
jgi:hypothetical protein